MGRRPADLSGRKIGMITVVERLEERDYKGSVMWRCKCDCGNEVTLSADTLINGRRRSCGCFKKEWNKNYRGEDHLTFVDGTCVEWLEHRKHRKDNSSGCRGVYPTNHNTYKVYIGFRKKRYYVGCFNTYEAAVAARIGVEDVLYGGFVNAYNNWKEHADRDPEWAAEHPFHFDFELKKGNVEIKGITES